VPNLAIKFSEVRVKAKFMVKTKKLFYTCNENLQSPRTVDTKEKQNKYKYKEMTNISAMF